MALRRSRASIQPFRVGAASAYRCAVAARYLYGDSEPFPYGYDFLAALKRFVGSSSKALALLAEADDLERSLGERAQERLFAIDAIAGFFGGLVDVVGERAARSGAPQIVGPYANQLVEQIEVLSAHARATIAKDLDADQVDVTSRIRDRRAGVKQALADFMLAEPLAVEEWALSLELAGTSPHGQAVLMHADEITTCFALDVGRDAAWARARRVGDLVSGLALQVGFKKAFLRSSLHPDVAALDELVIAGLELGPDSAEIRLRRKLDAPRDAFVITLDPDGAEDEGGLSARITRFENGTGASTPFASQGEDLGRILELVGALRREGNSLIAHKKRLLYVQLDGHDVLERQLVPALFARIAERMAPIAHEVARRSPSRQELSLKFQRDDGRREELYLEKSVLEQMVAPLPADLQGMYHHLGFLPEPVPLTTASAPAPARPSAMPPPRPGSMPPPRKPRP